MNLTQESISPDNKKIVFLRFFCSFLIHNNAYKQFCINCIKQNDGTHFIDSLKKIDGANLGGILWTCFCWKNSEEGGDFWAKMAAQCEKKWRLKLNDLK